MAKRVDVQLQPIYSARGDEDGAYCSILRVDDAVFLLDCGWSASLRIEDLEPLKK
jgi:Cft2 family RNA processing exonuclease